MYFLFFFFLRCICAQQRTTVYTMHNSNHTHSETMALNIMHVACWSVTVIPIYIIIQTSIFPSNTLLRMNHCVKQCDVI